MTSSLHPRIALTGAERSGKDEVGRILIGMGYTRYAFGDRIKCGIAKAPQWHLSRMMKRIQESRESPEGLAHSVLCGFLSIRSGRIDPFTEDDEQKSVIRPVLEQYGDAFEAELLREHYSSLPEKAVNTRLIKCAEAELWKSHGGVTFEVTRPERLPATQWSYDRLTELHENGYVDGIIENSGTIEDLRAAVLTALHVKSAGGS